jgi:hypothetical protein
MASGFRAISVAQRERVLAARERWPRVVAKPSMSTAHPHPASTHQAT